MPSRDPDALLRARQLYEQTPTPLREIGAVAGVSAPAIVKRARRDGWIRYAGARRSRKRTPTLPSRAEMVARLYRAFEQQVAEVESRLGGDADAGDRDARVLGTLARTLDKLIELEREHKEDRPDQEPVDLDRLRQKLADQLRRLGGGRS